MFNKLGFCTMAPDPISKAYFTNTSHQSLCLYILLGKGSVKILQRQQKNCWTWFSLRSVSCQGKQEINSSPEFLVSSCSLSLSLTLFCCLLYILIFVSFCLLNLLSFSGFYPSKFTFFLFVCFFLPFMSSVSFFRPLEVPQPERAPGFLANKHRKADQLGIDQDPAA